MRPVQQLVNGGGSDAPPERRGDCFRACVASILEIDPRLLPNPHAAPHWGNAWEAAVEPFGFEFIWNIGWFPKGYWIACVPSVNLAPGDRHCVVMHGVRLAHDPSPAEKVEKVRQCDVEEAIALLPFDPSGSRRDPGAGS